MRTKRERKAEDADRLFATICFVAGTDARAGLLLKAIDDPRQASQEASLDPPFSPVEV